MVVSIHLGEQSGVQFRSRMRIEKNEPLSFTLISPKLEDIFPTARSPFTRFGPDLARVSPPGGQGGVTEATKQRQVEK